VPSLALVYNTYGALNAGGDNAVVVGHSLTSNSCMHEWWSEMLGAGADFALDTTRYFVVCVNYLASVYGSDGPLTAKPAAAPASGDDGGCAVARYSADFPITSIRDNVVAQRALLEHLGVRRLALAIGGSLGGMLALEWAATYPTLVDRVVAIACPARHRCGVHRR